MKPTNGSKLGSRLVESGYLTEAQLWRALEAQRASGGRLGTILLEQKLLPEQKLVEALAAPHKTEAAAADDLREIPPDVLRLVPSKVALRLQVVPFRVVGARVHVAAKDPSSIPTMDELSFVTGKRVQMFAATELRIEEGLAKHYGKAMSARMRQALERANAAASEPTPPSSPPLPTLPTPPSTPSPRETSRPATSTQEVTPLQDARGPARSTAVLGALEIPEAPRPSQRNPAAARRAREDVEDGIDEAVEPAKPVFETSQTAPTPPPPPPPKRLVVSLKPAERARLREDVEPPKPSDTRIDRDRIAVELVADARKLLARVLLFRVRGDEIEGWVASQEIEAEALKKFRARFSELPIFLGLQQGSRFYLGPLPPMASHRRLAALWGGELPRDGVAMPIKLGERLVAVLYGDRGKEGLSGLPLAELEGSVAAAERALENAITRGKRSAS